MKIDLSVLISIVSVSIAIITIITNTKRNNKADTQKSTAELTTVLVKLEYISDGVADIKHELNNVKEDIRGLRDRATTHGEAIKSLLSRITELEKKVEKYHSN